MTELRRRGQRHRYSDGRYIQQRGEVKTSFSIVEQGQVLAGNVGADGAFLTTVLLHPGEHFGEFTLFAGLPRTQGLWARGEVEILEVEGPAFLDLFDREPELSRALYTIALRRIHLMVEFLDGMRRWPLEVRLAQILLTSAGSEHALATREIRVRHEDLATMLGVSRVAVGKALKKLQAEGLLETGYGRIHLRGVAALAEWVDARRQVSALPSHVRETTEAAQPSATSGGLGDCSSPSLITSQAR